MLWWPCAWHSRTGKIKAVDSGKVDKAKVDRRIKAVASGKDRIKVDRTRAVAVNGMEDKTVNTVVMVNGMEDKTVNTAITAATKTVTDITMNGVQALTRMRATGSDMVVTVRRRQAGMATIRTRGKLKDRPAFRPRGGRVEISTA